MAKSLNVVGIMNGTSLDGVDFVLCQIRLDGKQAKVKYLDLAASAFPKKLEKQLTRAARHELRVNDLSLVHHELGRFYAKELLRHCKRRKWKIGAIGVHGQTVFHQAPQATLQIGESAYLKMAFDVPVVSDFRVADLAAGGQAAPLAPLFHQIAFQALARKQRVAVQNLGGIANVTYLAKASTLAFDSGPANMLLDLAAKHFSCGAKQFDRNGAWAAQGEIHFGLVQKWLKHPYFAKRPPKSCGREEFGEGFFKHALRDLKSAGVKKTADQMATLTELTAASIAQAYQTYLPKMPQIVLLCGGGAKNTYLKKRLQALLPKTSVETTDDYGWPVSAIEGAAFALLAALRVWEISSDTRKFTGAKKVVLLGKVS